MTSGPCSIVLRERGEVIASVLTAPGGDEIWVGRSHQCTLRCREDDLSVSGRHARLFWDGNDLWVEDGGSRNGIYHNGVKLDVAHKLLAGEVLTLGGCTLVRENQVPDDASAKSFHQLEWCNGPNRGTRVDIAAGADGNPFAIGSAEGCALRLVDEFVSPRQCHFEVKPGGDCWAYDDGGVNGTQVNGEPLKEKGRLLRDGDLVTIAQFDFRFLDRAKPHRQFGLVAKLAAAVLALAALAAAYALYVVLDGDVPGALAQARKAAGAADFERAVELLDGARGERDARKYAAQIDGLERQVERWRRTEETWRKVRGLVADGSFASARKTLDPILCETADAWTWGDAASLGERRTAEFLAQALRQSCDVGEAVGLRFDGSFDKDIQRLHAVEASARRFLDERRDDFAARAEFGKLKERIESRLGELTGIRKGISEVDGVLAALGEKGASPADAVRRLTAISGDGRRPASVRSYAEKYTKPCQGFVQSECSLYWMRLAVTELDLTNGWLSAIALPLPPQDLCARHRQLSDFRDRLDLEQAEIRRLARALGPLVSNLHDEAAVLEKACSESEWRAALLDDVFARQIPSARRKEPLGPYDAMLGIEFAYRAVRTLPRPCDELPLRSLGFRPVLVAARRALVRTTALVAFVENGPAWLKAGALGRLNAECVRYGERRDAIVRHLTAFEGSARMRIAAGFAAHYLSREPDGRLAEKVAAEMKELRNSVARTLDADADAALDLAMPGDPAVHALWAKRSEAVAK